MYQMKAS